MTRNQISEKQAALAMCLGLQIRPGTTSRELSEQIDRHQSGTHDGPPNKIQVQLAKAWGLDVDGDATRNNLGWDLWHEYEDNPSMDVPVNVQVLVFGRSLESPVRSRSGCLGGIVAALVAAVTILLLLNSSPESTLP